MANKSEIGLLIARLVIIYCTISVTFELCHFSSCLVTHTAVEKRGMGSKSGHYLKKFHFYLL
jgi:hypothetical protein